MTPTDGPFGAEPPQTIAQDAGGEAQPCPLCQGAGYYGFDVPYGHPDFGRYVICECRQEALQERHLVQLLARSNLGPLRRFTFDSLSRQGRSSDPALQERFQRAVAVAQNYAAQPEGWLVLVGPSGCGKTHLAVAIANAALDRGTSVFFVSVPDLLDHLRASFAPTSEVSFDQLFEDARNVALLILDDLGSHSSTPWAQEKLFQLINYRYNLQLPTVFNTSLPLEGLGESLRTRLCDPDLSRVCLIEEISPPTPSLQDPLHLPLLKNMTFDTFEQRRNDLSREQNVSLEAAYKAAFAFAMNPEGQWLVFLGPFGCGKTHLAAAIANYRRQKGHPVHFVVVPDLLDYLRSTFSPDSKITYDWLFDKVRSTPLLILDDLGTQSSTPWALEKLYQIINYRYNARLPTVFTSSYALEEIETRLSSRMSDRRLGGVFQITAPDYRLDRVPSSPARSTQRGRRRL